MAGGREYGRAAQRVEDVLDMPGADAQFAQAGVGDGMGLTVLPAQAAPFQPMMPRKDRDIAKIKKHIAMMAQEFGQTPGYKWMYSWSTKNKDGTRSLVEGGTIKMANAIAQAYGNCDIDVRVIDQGAKWIFYARFVDMETGYSTVRSYQQRKEQTIGMKDAQRAMDIVFQIGQSKAIRNVILNALPHLAAFGMEEARKSNYSEVQKDPERARAWILKQLEKMQVDVKRIEKVYSRSAEHWTVPDMARITLEIESIQEGMANEHEVWPLETDDAETQNTGAGQPAAKAQPQPDQKPEQREREPAPQRAEPDQEQRTRPQGKSAAPPAIKIFGPDGVAIGLTTRHDYKTGDPIEISGSLYNVSRIEVNEETTLPEIHVAPVKRVQVPSDPKPVKAQPASKSAVKPMFGDD